MFSFQTAAAADAVAVPAFAAAAAAAVPALAAAASAFAVVAAAASAFPVVAALAAAALAAAASAFPAVAAAVSAASVSPDAAVVVAAAAACAASAAVAVVAQQLRLLKPHAVGWTASGGANGAAERKRSVRLFLRMEKNYIYNQCCGSVFWASWIRIQILLSSSKNSKKNI